MQLHQLGVFLEVARTKSFSKAAQELYLSQSTVSTHITNLEKYFRAPLFDRLGRQAVLTPFGERVYYWAQEIIDLRQRALDDLLKPQELAGTIQVAASSVPAQYLAPSLFTGFQGQYPSVRFSLTQGNSRDTALKLLRGQADIALTGDKPFAETINYTPLARDSLILITPKNTALSTPVHLGHLTGLKMILRFGGSGTQANLVRVLQDCQFDPGAFNTIGYFDNVQSIIQAVREGMGCSIISSLAADGIDSARINSYQVEEFKDYHRSFYVGVHRERTLSRVARAFLDYVQANSPT